jgi:hypothetical protein
MVDEILRAHPQGGRNLALAIAAPRALRMRRVHR